MKKILAVIMFAMFCLGAEAQMPKGYEKKTQALAENFVKCSKEGDYNKTYKALRDIQKYEFRLQKEELVTFYSDIHKAVSESCDRYGIGEEGKDQMWNIIDALFSDELKANVNN